MKKHIALFAIILSTQLTSALELEITKIPKAPPAAAAPIAIPPILMVKKAETIPVEAAPGHGLSMAKITFTDDYNLEVVVGAGPYGCDAEYILRKNKEIAAHTYPTCVEAEEALAAVSTIESLSSNCTSSFSVDKQIFNINKVSIVCKE